MTSPPPPESTPPRRRFQLPVVLYAHPFELAFGVVLVLNGVKALATGDLTPSVNATLPTFQLLAYRLMGLAGGLGVLVVLALRTRTVGRTIERSALWLTASSYLAYAVVLVGVFGTPAAWNALTAGAVGVGCILRAIAIRKTDRIILRQLRKANADPDPVVLRRLVDGRPPQESP